MARRLHVCQRLQGPPVTLVASAASLASSSSAAHSNFGLGSMTISDDGPGFSPEVLDRLGAPYVTHRRPEPRPAGDDGETVFGLGLGFFIAKTLLERSGATIAFLNRQPPDQGAVVQVRWARADFERTVDEQVRVGA